MLVYLLSTVCQCICWPLCVGVSVIHCVSVYLLSTVCQCICWPLCVGVSVSHCVLVYLCHMSHLSLLGVEVVILFSFAITHSIDYNHYMNIKLMIYCRHGSQFSLIPLKRLPSSPASIPKSCAFASSPSSSPYCWISDGWLFRSFPSKIPFRVSDI